jgi:hypothetical protein
MVLAASEYLDDETILNKLPFISIDEIQEILMRKDKEDEIKFNGNTDINDNDGQAAGPEDEEG